MNGLCLDFGSFIHALVLFDGPRGQAQWSSTHNARNSGVAQHNNSTKVELTVWQYRSAKALCMLDDVVRGGDVGGCSSSRDMHLAGITGITLVGILPSPPPWH